MDIKINRLLLVTGIFCIVATFLIVVIAGTGNPAEQLIKYNTSSLNTNVTVFESIGDHTFPPSTYVINTTQTDITGNSNLEASDNNHRTAVAASAGDDIYWAFRWRLNNTYNITLLNFTIEASKSSANAFRGVTYFRNFSGDEWIIQGNFTIAGGDGADKFISNWTNNSVDYVDSNNNFTALFYFYNENGLGGTTYLDFAELDLFHLNVTGQLAPGTVRLESPITGTVTTAATQDFRCSLNDTTNNIDNVTFQFYDSSINLDAETFRDLSSAGLNSGNESFNVASIAEDSYVWNCIFRENDTTGHVAFSNSTFTRDLTNPTIDIVLATNISLSTSFQVNYTFVEDNPNVCKYTINGGIGNTTFASCGTNASITANRGNNNLVVFISDTIGNEASDSQGFTVVNLPSETNVTNVTEASTQLFSIEVINGSSRLTSSTFTYNSTEQTITSTSNGTSLFLNSSVDLGLFPLRQNNISFFWNLTFLRGTDAVNITTPRRIQDVRQMFIGNCTDNIATATTLNFTIFEEGTTTEINATDINAEIKVWNRSEDVSRTFNFGVATNSTPTTNTSRFAFCILPTFANLSSDVFVQYGSDGFDTREFRRDSTSLDSTSQEIDLFLAASADTDTVTINVEDENGNELEGVVVEAHKKDIGTGNFTIVDIQSTNPDGVAVFDLIRGDNFYKFLFKIDGILGLETGEFKLEEIEYFFVITIGPPSVIDTLVELDSITYSLTFNSSGCNLFVFTWNDVDDIADSFRLLVSNITIQNGTLSSLSQTSTNQSGNLIYNLTTPSGTCTPINGTYLAQSFVTTTEDSDEHLLNSLTIIIRKIEEAMPPVGTRDAALFSLIVILTLFGVGMVSQNPSIYVGLGLVGMWIMAMINFLSIGTATIVSLAVVGMFFIWRLKT